MSGDRADENKGDDEMDAENMKHVVEWMEAQEAEMHNDLLKYLQGVRDEIDDECDVRIQVIPSDDPENDPCTYYFHSGDASYDPDHHGFWGAGTVSPHSGNMDLVELCRDMVTEAIESASQML